jgi:GTP-binding protein
MKFVDEAQVHIKAGDGGQGCVSFRREKFIPKGGPDGGDGGKGGDLVIIGNQSLTSLVDFRYKRTYRAENGRNGSGKKKTGRSGKDTFIEVPLGTLVFEATDTTPLCDITRSGETFVLAKGGKGGRGNVHFVSPTHRAPLEFDPGETGEEKDLRLVLKLLAQIGIVGLPNAGKSTLISCLTDARPRIGDYPFTTLTPSLGVLQGEEHTVVLADIPGIIEGASHGKGLGLQFLRHIERTEMILWVIDASLPTVMGDYETLREELLSYGNGLPEKKRLCVLNKADLAGEDGLAEAERRLRDEGEAVVTISALKGWGVEKLRDRICEWK